MSAALGLALGKEELAAGPCGAMAGQTGYNFDKNKFIGEALRLNLDVTRERCNPVPQRTGARASLLRDRRTRELGDRRERRLPGIEA